MKNLIIVRHAKSSWDEPLRDKERPLTKRGIKDAKLVSSHIKNSIAETPVFISSTAKRAVETAQIFAQNLSYPVECISYNDDLYTFSENKLEKVIKNISNALETVILFGHNEAITNFVNKFGDVYIENVPTSGFVSLEIDADDWKNIKKGKIKTIIFPKELR